MSEYQDEPVLQDLKIVLPKFVSKDIVTGHASSEEGQTDASSTTEKNAYAEWETLGKQLLQPIYQAEHAKTQAEYEEAYDRVFEELDLLEMQIESKDYLVEDQLTAADVRLYSVLVRFNIIYYFAFRLNRSQIQDYPNLWRYVRQLYAREEFRKVTDFEALKQEYYGNQSDIQNPYHIIANGPDMADWE